MLHKAASPWPLLQSALPVYAVDAPTDSTEKAYWSVTEAGLVYGKNITSPSNTRETQPHWYQCKAEEIRKIVADHLPSI